MVAQWGIPEGFGGIEPAATSVIESGAPYSVEGSECVYVPVGMCNGHVVLVVHRQRSLALPSSTAKAPPSVAAPFEGRLGIGQPMLELARGLEKSAAGEEKIMLFGETGTGKTMIAQLIHEASPRRKMKFQVVDCSGLMPEQFESKFFGHEKGAFTGAVQMRVGALEEAKGGTLFLDEVGELPLEMQLRLLNTLENKTFHRMGASANARPKECDVRLIVATHCNLEEKVSLGQFRADLYYRLEGERFTIPALRERGDDLLRLAAQLLAELSRSTGPVPKHLTPAARKAIASFPWPGNVRELITVLRRASRAADSASVDVHHLALGGGSQGLTAGSTTVLPPAPGYALRATPITQPFETDAPNQKQIETFLVSFFKHWRTGAHESKDVLLTVLGQMGGGKPAKWLHYFRQGLLAGVGDSIEQNKLGDRERLDLRDAILSEAGDETGREAWAAAAARLLGAGARAAPLVKKAKEVAGS